MNYWDGVLLFFSVFLFIMATLSWKADWPHIITIGLMISGWSVLFLSVFHLLFLLL